MMFSGITGHEREIEALRRAVAGTTVAGAYLFAGPEGVGKMLTARAFAAALNCEQFSGDSCGQCPSCRAFDSNSSSNFIVVAPAEERKSLKIEAVRDLQQVLHYSVEGGRRVAVIDGAEKLLRNASNVLLKTLEEPPGGVVVILISSKPDSLLPTILSRCRRVNFRPLSVQAAAGFLMERRGMGKEEALETARLSGGAAALALRYAEQGLAQKRREFIRRFCALSGVDAAGVVEFAGALAKDEGVIDALEFLKSWLRDAAVESSGAPELKAGTADEPVGEKIAGGRGGRGGAERLALAFAAVEETLLNIQPPRNANKALAIEALTIRLFN